MGELEFHPLANLFPLIEGQPFDDLVADVKAKGIREPIVLFEGKILDGRNRFRAGRAAGILQPDGWTFDLEFQVGPTRREFRPEAEGDPLAFVLSLNLHRRHLTESQRAMVAAKLESYRHGGSRRGDGATDQEANLPVESIALTRSEAAEIAKVSPRSVTSARAVLDHGAPELVAQVEQGGIAVSAAADIARLPIAEQQDVIRNADPAALYRVIKEKRDAKTALKKEQRDAKEAALAEKISAGNAALAGMVVARKRYGVILADPEWRFEPFSRESGMDRAPENHYPTTPTDEICARPVRELAADDAVLLLWATVPMLPDALRVMAAWGFTYKSHACWLKDVVGTGYWFRNQHELLLVGTRGAIPAPAMGTQFRSALAYPVGEHSEKPPFAHEIAEAYWPNLPKIEMNARTAREGWDLWGAEAPDHVPDAGKMVEPDHIVDATTMVGGDDVDARGEPEHDAGDAEEAGDIDEVDEEPAPMARKGRKAKAVKPDSWQVERDECAARIEVIAADLPDDLDALTTAYGEAIDLHHDAVMREAAGEAWPLRERMEAILYKANGCTSFGVGCNDAPMAIRRSNWAPIGSVPKWGQVGQFILEHRDIRAIICFGEHEGIHAVDFNRPFPSETGFHSIGAVRAPGMTVEDYGRAMIDGSLAYVPGGGKGKPRKPARPDGAYRLARDARGYLIPRQRGVLIDAAAPPAGLDVADLDAIAGRWREEDRARLIGEKKGKRSLPESRRPDRKIIAIDGAMLTPLADYPEAGAYVVSCCRWDGAERIEGWRFIADAALIDDEPLFQEAAE